MLPFLTTNQTAPPLISALAYALMISLVVLSIYGAVKYHDNPGFVKAFKWIQFVQLWLSMLGISVSVFLWPTVFRFIIVD